MIISVGTKQGLSPAGSTSQVNVTFETSLTQIQILELSKNKQAIYNCLYIGAGKEGGIFIGNEDGTVREVSDLQIWE